jgi:putative transcriptional regulator
MDADEKSFLGLLGNNIRKYRALKSYSQSNLSDDCNIAKSTIQRIESGKLNPTILMLKKIASNLEVEIEDLIK